MSKFISTSGAKATVVLQEGNQPDTTHEIDANAVVTLNGNPAKLTDLRGGDDVQLSGQPATSVTATRKP